MRENFRENLSNNRLKNQQLLAQTAKKLQIAFSKTISKKISDEKLKNQNCRLKDLKDDH